MTTTTVWSKTLAGVISLAVLVGAVAHSELSDVTKRGELRIVMSQQISL